MYRDFAADRSVGADEHSSTYRESASTVLKSFHVASATAEEEAELIMRRLVRNYLERSPLSHHEGQDGFRSSWGKLSDRACIGDLTFHDLGGTAVVRLAIAGATALRELRDGNAKPFAFSCTQHIVECMRKATSKVDHVEALAH